jgi:hypothetical protein
MNFIAVPTRVVAKFASVQRTLREPSTRERAAESPSRRWRHSHRSAETNPTTRYRCRPRAAPQELVVDVGSKVGVMSLAMYEGQVSLFHEREPSTFHHPPWHRRLRRQRPRPPAVGRAPGVSERVDPGPRPQRTFVGHEHRQ